ncbi:MAG: hypothetical protein ORN57_02125, partial [Alphaproteobacteria bacterium]|nr:hypothetical protein [Alphaproteobacteria bacterium]
MAKKFYIAKKHDSTYYSNKFCTLFAITLPFIFYQSLRLFATVPFYHITHTNNHPPKKNNNTRDQHSMTNSLRQQLTDALKKS